MIYYVYCHKKGDGTIFYIGKGKDNRAYSKESRNIIWQRIVKKHNYTVEILFNNLSEIDAYKKEIELISHHSPKANISKGGNGGDIISQLPPEQKAEILLKKSKSMTGKNLGNKNGMYGKSHSVEQIQHLSLINSGVNHPQFGTKKSNETKSKIRATKTHKFKKIYCKELDRTFECTYDAVKELNLDKGNLQKVLKGKNKTIKGLSFKYV